jgi:hypothetical protein
MIELPLARGGLQRSEPGSVNVLATSLIGELHHNLPAHRPAELHELVTLVLYRLPAIVKAHPEVKRDALLLWVDSALHHQNSSYQQSNVNWHDQTGLGTLRQSTP